MHAISTPRREFGWTRIRAAPNEPTMGDCKQSAELLPVPTRLAISPLAEAASRPNSERAANIAFAQRVAEAERCTAPDRGEAATGSGAGWSRSGLDAKERLHFRRDMERDMRLAIVVRVVLALSGASNAGFVS